MADDETTEEEPSIEEILDSIRQIISDDDEEEAPAEAAAEEDTPAEPAPASEPKEDVVELTDKIDEPKAEPEPKPEPKPEPTPEPEPEDEAVEVEMREPEEEIIDFDDADASGDDGDILTGVAEAAAYDGFEKLVKKTAVEYNGITLEEIVRTELKPLLREWLDDNLPTMIERLVKEELERVSKSVLGE